MNVLGMFAKYWEPGAVKTRLAATVGEEAAAMLHHQFVRTLLYRLRSHADSRQICYAPSNAKEAFETAAGERWSVHPQSDGDLGVRMRTFFDNAFAGGASRVVLIGSDSPSLPVQYIDQAFQLLETHDVVLGPAEDGGYYLIGAASQTPDVFDGVSWSSGDVWDQTVAKLDQAGISFASLPVWYDVDLWTDLQRLLADLQTTSISPSLLQLVRQVVAKHPGDGGGAQ